jgi:hypothetical protein
MRVYVIFKEESDHGREVREYLRDFYRQTGHELERVNPDSREGGSMCELYDVVEYPSILAVSNNGELLQVWRGLPLPQIMEVSCYASQT